MSAHAFYGEAALVEHAFKSGLLDQGKILTPTSAAEDTKTSATAKPRTKSAAAETTATSAAAKTTTSAAAKRTSSSTESAAEQFDADSIITASQIDTSVELSQRTLDALLDSNLDVELSHAAVSLEFGLSASCLTVDESQQQAAASLQLLSEASGLESDSEPPARPAATTDPTLRPQIKTDVNFVADDECMNEHESFSSGESDGQYITEDEGDSPACEESDGDDDVISEADAVQMDDAFIRALQISSDALNKKAKKAREAVLRGMHWTSVSSTFESDAPAYDGLGDKVAHPKPELRARCHLPLESFLFFMPKSLGDSEETGLVAARDDSPNPAETQGEAGVSDARDPSCRRSARGAPAVPTEAPLLRALDDGRGRRFARRDLREVHDPESLHGHHPRSPNCEQRGPTHPEQAVEASAGRRQVAAAGFDGVVVQYDANVHAGQAASVRLKNVYDFFEIYAGKRRSGDDDAKFDHKTGAIAVVRNLNIILGPDRLPWHAVVIDRLRRHGEEQMPRPPGKDPARNVHVLALGRGLHHGSVPLMGPQACALPVHGRGNGRVIYRSQREAGGCGHGPMPGAGDRLPALDGRS
ncbi:hypothetical protein ON010_g2068 [Phytophthora cinnamomi]|nr:hypothetical protein ON010_g2068 [Phytophthora cinnamomi]